MATTLSLIYKADKSRKFFWQFFSKIMPLIALFLIAIIYSRKLSYDNYGKFQSVWMYINIVNVVIGFGLSSVIFSTNLNFLFSFIKTNRKILSRFYTILWFAGLALFFVFAKNFNTSLKFLLIAFIIIQNITTVTEVLLIKRGKEKISGIINFFYAFLFFGWHIYVLLTGYSLFHLIAGITIISIIKLIVIAMIPVKNGDYIENTDEKHFLYHWGYLGMSDVVGVIARWMDKAFLLYLLTATDFAIFFNGSFEIPLFGFLISITGNFLMIEISANTQAKDKVIKLFHESFKMLSTIVFPLFFFLFFFREELFSLVFNNRYNASLPIFAISIFIIPLRISNYSVILQCFGQGKKVLLGSILDIVIAFILMLVLYPLTGTRGIALAIVISTYCQVFYYLWHSGKILNTPIYQILPLQKLITKFLAILALYIGLFYALSGVEIKIKLLTAIIFTLLIEAYGISKYFRLFFQKSRDQNK